MNQPLPDVAAEAGDAGTGDADDLLADDGVERRHSVVAPELHRARLDKALVAAAPEFSRSHLQSLIEAGHVSLDGEPGRTPAQRVRAGQRIAVTLMPTDESRAFRAEPMAMTVPFEDAHLLVVDKPAGLVVHPAAGHWTGTLMNGLLARHAGAAALPRAGIVHRLDKDTSGLMVVAKTLPAHAALVRAISERQVQREYLALAHGAWPAAYAHVDAPIGRDPKSRVRMAVVGSGRAARTDVVCVGRGHAEGRAVSALRCRLHSGRTHQIRVHLASRGHPLLADALYGGAPALGMTRQALHAVRLSFTHPHSGAALSFVAPPPADFAAAWQTLGIADPLC